MENVIKISIGSWAFTLQQSAYDFIDNWFGKYKASLDGSDNKDAVYANAEECIGAWLADRVKSVNQVVDTPLLKQAIIDCGLPLLESGDVGNGEAAYTSQDDSAKATAPSRRHLVRDKNDRRLGGVLSGLAAYLGTSATLLRVVFAVLLCFFIWMDHRVHGDFFETLIWIEAIVYIILWICIPEGRLPKQAASKVADETETAEPLASGLGRIIRFALGCILLLVGVCGLLFLPLSAMFFPKVILSILSTIPFAGNLVFVKVLLVIFFVIPQLFFIYEGVKLLFGFHFKKLHIGIVLILLWIVNVFVLGCTLAGNFLAVPKETNSAWKKIGLQSDTLFIQTVAPGWNDEKSYAVQLVDDMSFLWLDGRKAMYVLPVIDVDWDDDPAGFQMEYKLLGSPFEDRWFDASDIVSFRNDTLTIEAKRFDRNNPWRLDRMKLELDVPHGTSVVVCEPDGWQTEIGRRNFIPFLHGHNNHSTPIWVMEYGE